MSPLRLATVVVCLLVPSVSFAQRGTPLDIIPDSAAFVLRVQAPETTIEDLAGFADKVQPGLGGIIRVQGPSIGGAIINPGLTGVDQTKDWYGAVFVEAGGRPKGVLIIPATDVDAMKNVFNDRVVHMVHEGWVIYSHHKAAVDRIKACIDGGSDAISGQMPSRSVQAFATSHVGMYLNGVALKETFATELDSANDVLEQGLSVIGEQIARTNPALELDYVIDMYRDFGTALIQSVRDSDSVTLSVGVVDDALQLDKQVSVAAGSPTDQFISSQPTSDLTRMKSLPEGLLGYYGVHGDAAVMMDWLKDFSTKMIKDEKAAAVMEKSFAAISETKFGAITGGMTITPNQKSALQYYGLSEMVPASKLLDAFRALDGGLEYEVTGITQKQTFLEAAEQLDGHDVHLFKLEQQIPAELDPMGFQKKINEMLYGPDGMTQRIIVKDNTMMQVLGGDSETPRALLKGETWSDEHLLTARSRLPEQANFIGLVNLPGSLQAIAQVVFSSGAVPELISPDQLAGLDIPTSYVGMSTTLGPQQLDARLTIPVETFQGVLRLGMFVQGAMGALGR